MRRCRVQQDTFKALRMGNLEEKLQEHEDKRTRVVITDGVFSMDGDVAKLDENRSYIRLPSLGPAW
jgi:glycine C-acetyltransferase